MRPGKMPRTSVRIAGIANRDPRHEGSILVQAPLRLLHVHQDDHPQVEERRGDARDTPIRARASVAGADRRGEDAHLRHEPDRGRDARQREEEQRHEGGQQRAALDRPAYDVRDVCSSPLAETSITTPNAPSVIRAYAIR